MIGFVTLGHLLFIGDDAKKVAKGDKTNHSQEYTLQIVTCMCYFEVKNFNK